MSPNGNESLNLVTMKAVDAAMHALKKFKLQFITVVILMVLTSL